MFTTTPKIQIGRRKVRRVKVRIRFTVTGFDQYGMPFTDLVETENVSRTGGCLVFDRDLRRNQSIRLEARNGLQFPARVRWCVHVDGILRRCGFELTPSSQRNNGWVVADPTRQYSRNNESVPDLQLWFPFVADDAHSSGSSDS
jgi:hypothetical protein